jgi:predicted ATP-grasp superfamily ATP-dependent carboligase
LASAKTGNAWQAAEPVTLAANDSRWQDFASTCFDIKTIDVSTPAVLLGGRENCLAVTRNFGRLGIKVYVSGRKGCHALYSRNCRRAFPVERGVSAEHAWCQLLIGSPPPELQGAIVFAMCDESLEFLATHHAELNQRYKLPAFVPDLYMAMLDKRETLVRARAAGVPTPNFWVVDTAEELSAIRDEIQAPVMVKPLNSRAFVDEFGCKLFIVDGGYVEVVEKVGLCHARGIKVMVVEMIPGPDSLLSSFNTCRTASGEMLYEYTKSIIRRWPVNRGGATFHQSVWLPETAAMGRKMFDGIGWQGIGNVEFKRDIRDGKLKIIEVNGRFTAAQRLITEAGAPIDLIVYCHLTGQPRPHFDRYSQTKLFWYPLRDFFAFVQMRRAGQITFAQWLRSLDVRSLLLSVASWRDPLPSIVLAWSGLRIFASAPAKYLHKVIATKR